MTLLFQALAVLAAAGALVLLTGQRVDRARLPLGVALAVTALLAVVAVSGVWGSSRTLNNDRVAFARLDEAGGRGFCILETGVKPKFGGWVVARIPPYERYHLSMPPAPVERTADLCAGMVLLPRRRVADPADARYRI